MSGERTSSTELVRVPAKVNSGESSLPPSRELTPKQMELRCGCCTFIMTTLDRPHEAAGCISSREDRWTVMLVGDDGNTIGQVVD
jgi:hypothetical protein